MLPSNRGSISGNKNAVVVIAPSIKPAAGRLIFIRLGIVIIAKATVRHGDFYALVRINSAFPDHLAHISITVQIKDFDEDVAIRRLKITGPLFSNTFSR